MTLFYKLTTINITPSNFCWRQSPVLFTTVLLRTTTTNNIQPLALINLRSPASNLFVIDMFPRWSWLIISLYWCAWPTIVISGYLRSTRQCQINILEKNRQRDGNANAIGYFRINKFYCLVESYAFPARMVYKNLGSEMFRKQLLPILKDRWIIIIILVHPEKMHPIKSTIKFFEEADISFAEKTTKKQLLKIKS